MNRPLQQRIYVVASASLLSQSAAPPSFDTLSGRGLKLDRIGPLTVIKKMLGSLG
jgi:hypothetical protein